MFSEGNDEFVICLDASNGEEMWRFRSDSTYYEYEGGNGPRATPTIDEEFLFTVSAQGRFYALSSVNGEKVWSYDLIKDFGSYMPKWGFSSSPLVEGNLLLVEVGGDNGKFIVAFDKTNGDVLWSSHTDKTWICFAYWCYNWRGTTTHCLRRSSAALCINRQWRGALELSVANRTV